VQNIAKSFAERRRLLVLQAQQALQEQNAQQQTKSPSRFSLSGLFR
jgi:hypothetical protein